MVVCIEAVAMPPVAGEKGRAVQLYAYHLEEAPGEGCGTRILDNNHAIEIVGKLVGGRIIEGEPPRGDGYKPLWQVKIRVMRVHRDTASYQAEYHKENGCPANAIELMMAVYGMVKKVLREALKGQRAKRKGKAKA